MSDNVQKYENWRAITESDYVTMFIKTWFAFVATLRELYPKENLNDVIGKGDKVFLNPYLDDFEEKYHCYNSLKKSLDDILKVYMLGREYTLRNNKYNRFFSEDFYAVNKAFSWRKSTEEYECSLKYSSDFVLSIHVKYLDSDFLTDGKPLIISEKVDISDLISSCNLTKSQIESYLDDEAAFINYVAAKISERVSVRFISHITNGDFQTVFSSKVLARFNSLTLSINADIVLALAQMKDPNIQKENLLFSQMPCSNFIYKVEDGADIPDSDTYKWFLNFVYFMRNALFHEIIDPLDSFWQDIFKHSYLALKEILDGNINYFIEKEKVIEKIRGQAWDEIGKFPSIYVPDYNEAYNDNDVVIEIADYSISDNNINAKANIFLDYWCDEHSMKRMCAVCRVEITREDTEVNKFAMKLIELKDITVGE